MGILIAVVLIALGGLAIGVTGGIISARTHQTLASLAGTVVCYYVLVGTPWAMLIMESGGNWVRSFGEAFLALARSLLLLGLLPLLITFAIAAWMAR